MKFLGFVRWVLCTSLFVVGLSLASARQVSVHDPVMAKEGNTYYVFSTGPGITFYSSTDMVNWHLCGRIFPGDPSWAKKVAPTFDGHIWAPDIVHHNGEYYLYYAVSAFGKNTSAIGVTINKTLDPNSPDYHWSDQGIVLESIPNRDLWNAIDPAVFIAKDGTPWLTFGSFWEGIKQVKLAPNMTSIAKPQKWYSLAKRERSVLVDDTKAGPAEIEAPFIFHRGDYYYLFVSWGLCCRGVNSTYRIVIGRSKSLHGPYLDKTGQDMAKGGGTLLLGGDYAWPGLGHCGVYDFGGKDYMIFHAYERADHGLQKMKIAQLSWTADGWPVVNKSVLKNYVSKLIK